MSLPIAPKVCGKFDYHQDDVHCNLKISLHWIYDLRVMGLLTILMILMVQMFHCTMINDFMIFAISEYGNDIFSLTTFMYYIMYEHEHVLCCD